MKSFQKMQAGCLAHQSDRRPGVAKAHLLLAAAVAAGLGGSAHAVVRTYNGGNSAINTTSNYTPSGTIDQTTDLLIDTASPTGATTLTLSGTNLSAQSFDVNNANALTLATNTTTATNSIFTLGNTGGQNNAVSGAAAGDLLYIGGTNSSLTIKGANNSTGSGVLILNLAQNGNFDVASSSASLSISAVIQGSFGFAKTGSGTLTLSGLNTYIGTTTLSAGTLKTGNTNTFLGGTGAVQVDGGTMDLSGISVNVGALSGAGGTILNNTTATNVTLTAGVGSTSSTSYAGVIRNNTSGTGTVALTKVGTGALTLTGANLYTGATSIQVGGIVVDLTTGSLGSTSSLALGGSTTNSPFSIPTLTIKGNASGTSAQTLGNLTLNSSDSAITIDPNGGAGTTLTLGNTWTRSTGGGTLALTLPAGATLASNPSASLQGSILPFVIVNGTDFGAISGGAVVAYTGYNVYAGTAPTSLTTSNLKVDSSTTGNVAFNSGTTAQNSILVSDVTARTIDIGAGNTLNLGVKGAILAASGSGAVTIGQAGSAGTINAGGTTTNAAGELIFSNSTANTMTVNSLISNHGTGAVALTKSGTGVLLLNNTGSTYSGGTFINGGTLQQGAANTLGVTTGNLTVNSGAVMDLNGHDLSVGVLSGGGTVANNQSSSNAAFTVSAGNVSSSFAGVITDHTTGTGTLSLVTAGSLTLPSANTYSGGTTVTTGTLSIGDAGALGTGSLTINSGGIVNTTSLTLNTTPIFWNGDFRATTKFLTNFSLGAGTVTLGANVQLTGGNNTFSSLVVVAGTIQNDSPSTPRSLTVLGGGGSTGGFAFGGTNTFSGGFILNGGLIRINSNQALGLGAFTVDTNGGTIQSNGTAVLTGVTGISIQGDIAFSATAGAINLGTAAVTMTGARKMTVDNGPVTMGGNISGVGASIFYNGTNFSGSLSLNGTTSSFDGGVLVNSPGTGAATLGLGGASAAGTGQLRLSSSNLSRVSLSTNVTVDSLATAVQNPTTSAGTNYTVAPTVQVSAPAFGGTAATVTTSLSAGGVVFTVTNYGSGYTAAPTYTLVGGTTTGTAATIVAPTYSPSIFTLGSNTLTIAGTNATPAVYAGQIAGAGSIVKKGAGTQWLAGPSQYTGATTVSAGTLVVAENAVSTNIAGSVVTVSTANDTFTLAGNTLVDGNKVIVNTSGGTGPAGYAANVVYFVRDVSGNTFKVSLTNGGAALDLTTAATTTTVSRIGALGSNATTVALGDASSGSNTINFLTGAAVTVERNIAVNNFGNGTTIGGATADSSTYQGNITLSKAVALQAATGGTVEFKTGTWTSNNNDVTVGTSGNAGTVLLSNTLNTAGAVNVAFGTLNVAGALGGGGGNVSVAGGAKLAAALTGTIAKNVSVNSTGVLELTTNTTLADDSFLTLNNGSTLNLLFNTGNEAVRGLTIGGDVYTWSGTDIVFTPANGFVVNGTDYSSYFNSAGGGLAVTPEPASLGLVGLAGAGLLGRRRRRR